MSSLQKPIVILIRKLETLCNDYHQSHIILSNHLRMNGKIHYLYYCVCVFFVIIISSFTIKKRIISGNAKFESAILRSHIGITSNNYIKYTFDAINNYIIGNKQYNQWLIQKNIEKEYQLLFQANAIYIIQLLLLLQLLTASLRFDDAIIEEDLSQLRHHNDYHFNQCKQTTQHV